MSLQQPMRLSGPPFHAFSDDDVRTDVNENDRSHSRCTRCIRKTAVGFMNTTLWAFGLALGTGIGLWGALVMMSHISPIDVSLNVKPVDVQLDVHPIITY